MDYRPRVSIRRNHDLRLYILPTETVVLATRRHWASLLEPAATAIGTFLVVAVIVYASPPSAQDAVGWLWFVWLFTLLRFGFRWLEWAHEWFVSTDKRLLLLYGLVIHKVAMMPLVKVTDMGYSRTPLGQLLGYGRFVMESAGQDQALRQVDYVPHPDATYRTLVAEIFRPAGTKPPSGSAPASDAPPPTPGGPTPLPVVIVPGRVQSDDDARPTTQPIPVGRSGKPVPPSVAVKPAGPASPSSPVPSSASSSASSASSTTAEPTARDASASPKPHWETPPEWRRPKPYDSYPR